MPPAAINAPAPTPAATTIAEAEHCDPPDRYVDDRRDPFRRLDQIISTTIPAAAPAHTATSSASASGFVDHQDAERRHGPGDQQEDHRMVEPAHPAPHVRAHPVTR